MVSNEAKIILEGKQLTKQYPSGEGTITVLKGIDLSVKEGEILVIMGPSGAGKSTLLHILGTLDRPSSGELLINGINTSQLRNSQLAAFRNKNLGFVFQFHYLLPEFTALENLLIPAMIAQMERIAAQERAIELLREVGLEHRLHHRPSQLSGGEQQRVAVARALMNHPRIILADEPTGNLDSNNSRALFDLILGLNRKYRQTFVIVTHHEMFVEKAHRVVHLLDGMIEKETVLN
ncbi:MAG: ABC transporter ATP-binding protein [Calditrichia bacterium]